MFSGSVVKQLVESINIYGFSVQKFKRTLKMLLTQHFFENPLVYVHQEQPECKHPLRL